MKRSVLGLGVIAALILAPLGALAQDRVRGDAIRDRIRDRIEARRMDRAPQIGTAARAPGGGPGYESLMLKGVVRTFMRFTPNAVLMGGKRSPVVFALHGGKGTAAQLQSYLGLNAVAEKEGFLVVYPQGIENVWNDGRKSSITGDKYIQNVDDVGFLNALADALVAQGVADPKRMYIAGLSNGGFMTLNLACEGNTRFAAFGAVIASMPAAAQATCKPDRPTPVVMINGTDDALIRMDGAPGRLGIAGNLPPPAAAEVFAGLAGCKTAIETALPPRDPNDKTSIQQRVWNGCGAGSGVEFFTVKGGGHQSPTTHKASGGVFLDMFLGPRSTNLDTAETIWGFFKRFER
jgi:polyhydroxybutyrate depolymerase